MIENEKVLCKIKCLNCKKWFPSPIQLGDTESFFSSYLVGNIVKCPYCGENTCCNKENMLFNERNSEGMTIHHEEGEDTL